jgi:hypothetical protein
MKIDKVWFNKKEKEHNIIAFADNTLYRVKSKDIEFQRLKNELNRGIISDQFIGIPLGYMTSIELQENKNFLNIKYGSESEEQIIISNKSLKLEIFNYIYSIEYFTTYDNKKPSIIERIKKPLIALLVVLGIFTYVFLIINGMNQGYEYEVSGGRPGIGGFILIFADLGLMKNILIFGSLAMIAIFRMYMNFKDDGKIQILSN